MRLHQGFDHRRDGISARKGRGLDLDPLGVATLKDMYSDVADDGARFSALMSDNDGYFEEQARRLLAL